ncbi:MAG: Gfo/Idh/MocA family oxidoreductase [Deltaproteobacteria bacterium]|nr:Gfo/Idh/MocA family oxidoreductase [Candidatus Tharpella aukensis]
MRRTIFFKVNAAMVFFCCFLYLGQFARAIGKQAVSDVERSMKIGIIGAENSHTAAIAKTINIDKRLNGVTVDYVWGETEEYAREAAEKGDIPHIVSDPKEMLGKIDALIIDHRHPKYHLEAALPFVKEGVPIFIDKPFCYRAKEGEEFLKIAAKYGAPITSFSVLTHQESFADFIKKLEGVGEILAGETWGRCDLKSQWGGVFFYGIHQVDMALDAFGYDVKKVLITQNGHGATGQLMYPDGKIVTLHLMKKGYSGFGIGAMGSKKTIHQQIEFDENMYLAGIQTFTAMFKTRQEPKTVDEMLIPIRVLEALEKSCESGEIEEVQ